MAVLGFSMGRGKERELEPDHWERKRVVARCHLPACQGERGRHSLSLALVGLNLCPLAGKPTTETGVRLPGVRRFLPLHTLRQKIKPVFAAGKKLPFPAIPNQH